MSDFPQPGSTRAAYVAQALADAVERGDFGPGDRLPGEGALASEFDVSRPIVREALNQLVGRRLLRVENGRPPVVLPPGPKSLTDYFRHAAATRPETAVQLLEVRRGLEHQCALLASKHRDEDDNLELRAIIVQMRHAIDDTNAYARLDSALHMAIAKISKNPFLEDLLEALREQVVEKSIAAGLVVQSSELQRELVQQVHEDIVDGIVSADPLKTSESVRRHFEMALKALAPDYR